MLMEVTFSAEIRRGNTRFGGYCMVTRRSIHSGMGNSSRSGYGKQQCLSPFLPIAFQNAHDRFCLITFLQYKVFIYHPDGRLAKTYSAYDSGLGIKTVRWSPSSQFLAIGSYDQKVGDSLSRSFRHARVTKSLHICRSDC